MNGTILRNLSKYFKVDKMITGDIPEFGIKASDKVLDVGSGHCAFSRANVIYDKFPETEYDKAQRLNDPINIPEGVKFIQGDAADMSCFNNKEFNFVLCSETLNHVNDPIAVCKELIRVAKRGYISVGSALYAILWSDPGHIWQCFWDGITLEFLKNHYP